MRMPSATVAVLALLTATPTSTQDPLPSLVSKGLASLRAGQCEAAFKSWTENWTAPGDAPKREQIIGGCTLLSQLGVMRGFDTLRTVNVSPHVQRRYLVLLYDKQPVYFMIVLYGTAATLRVLTLNWNTDYDKVIPGHLFGEERPRP